MSATQPVPGLEVDFEPDTEDLTALPVDADGEYEPSPYLQAVAQRVHRVIESAWWDQPLSVRDIAAILSEGLYQMHRDIRAGQKVDIEYRTATSAPARRSTSSTWAPSSGSAWASPG